MIVEQLEQEARLYTRFEWFRHYMICRGVIVPVIKFVDPSDGIPAEQEYLTRWRTRRFDAVYALLDLITFIDPVKD
jgi:hypothetical protein